MKVRRRARMAVLQALFETDLVEHDAQSALAQRLAEAALPSAGVAFCRRLMLGVVDHRDALDLLLQRIAPERPLAQISPVDRNILRLAAFEILVDDDTPPKVVINEAVELAKTFGSDSSSRFVNGVLGTVYTQKHELAAQLAVAAAPSGGEDRTSGDA